jgi:oligopeptide/dipeptide ABC transporter ATP-binding protein
MTEPVLQVHDLTVVFETFEGRYSALNSVDLTINEVEIVGLVGESGCGKSTLALAVMGLLPHPPARVLSGSITFRGSNLLTYTEEQMEHVRGTGISMIFQEPLTSLNPLFTIGDQLSESIIIKLQRAGADVGRRTGKVHAEVVNWLKHVDLADPESAMDRYPHEWSGGMRQRVMIAMALSSEPQLMLADEPTSALDVTTQAQILRLVKSLVKEVKASVLFISHDLAVVAQIADRVAVMYAGMVVEEASVNEIFEHPLHPYTQALLSSFPKEKSVKKSRLEIIPGSVPNLTHIPSGCPFHPRCKYVREVCSTARPELRETSPGHKVACVLYDHEQH